MIYKDFIKCYSYDDYVENKEQILPETIVFNAEEGNEKLITLNYEFDFVPSGGEVGLVLTKDEEGLNWKDLQSGEFSEEAIANFFDDVKFYGDTNELIFSNKGKEVKRLDATPFIVDNFVKEVDVVGTDLVITFNTEDKPAIRVPLSKIFNPDNFYTKGEIESKFVTFDDVVTEDKNGLLSKNDYIRIKNSGRFVSNEALRAVGETKIVYAGSIDKLNKYYIPIGVAENIDDLIASDVGEITATPSYIPIDSATSTTAGVMSAADKVKLDNFTCTITLNIDTIEYDDVFNTTIAQEDYNNLINCAKNNGSLKVNLPNFYPEMLFDAVYFNDSIICINVDNTIIVVGITETLNVFVKGNYKIFTSRNYEIDSDTNYIIYKSILDSSIQLDYIFVIWKFGVDFPYKNDYINTIFSGRKHEIHNIIINDSNEIITIPIPNGNTYFSNIDNLEIEPGKIGEINNINHSDYAFIRAI